MDLNSEKLRLLDLDLQFQDDNTSCSSSLSTAVSEDLDDLRLGAEANSFTTKLDESACTAARNLVRNFVIMKENRDLHRQEDLNCTFSTISSISDLIDAREGKPDDLLLGLGFAPFEGEESRSSILSRFSSPIKNALNSEFQQEGIVTGNIGPEAHHGITKTQEWLDRQENLTNSVLQSGQMKESSNGNKPPESFQPHQQSQFKRITPQRKRLRWSKSRQSSFEHLLPNLEEEDAVAETEKSDSSDASISKREPPIPPIRESSQEKVFTNQDGESKDQCPKLKTPPVHNILQDEELNIKLVKLEKQQNFDHHDIESFMLTEFCNPAHRDVFSQYDCFHKLNVNSEEAKQSVEQSDPTLMQFSPWKHLKAQNLMKAKVDSFELEEIASNDSRQSPGPNSLVNCRQCRSAAASECQVLDINANKRCLDFHYCQLPVQHSNSDLKRCVTPPPFSSSTSSSGFDEGSEEIMLQEDFEKEEKSRQKYSFTVAQAILESVLSSFAPSKAESRLEEFSSSRSKMACAAGVAEAALRLHGAKQLRRSPAFLSEEGCAAGLSPVSSEKTADRSSTKSLTKSKTGIYGTSTPMKKFAMAGSSCAKSHACPSSGLQSKDSKTKQFSLWNRSRTLSPEPCLAYFNTNNSNSNINSSFEVDRGRLCRYSSMPTLRTLSPSPHRKISWHSPGVGGFKARQDSRSGLISSINAVSYLSLRSSTSHSFYDFHSRKSSSCSAHLHLKTSPEIHGELDAHQRSSLRSSEPSLPLANVNSGALLCQTKVVGHPSVRSLSLADNNPNHKKILAGFGAEIAQRAEVHSVNGPARASDKSEEDMIDSKWYIKRLDSNICDLNDRFHSFNGGLQNRGHCNGANFCNKICAHDFDNGTKESS